ncbi:MAG: GlxA family transcriptional regulator [Marmoricola sp.]
MTDLTVVVLRGAYPTSVAVTVDVLRAAAELAPRLGLVAPTWKVCSVDGGPLELQGGLTVATTRLPARPRTCTSTWVLPGLGTVTADAVQARLEEPDAVAVGTALARHARGGGQVAASCAAVFLLQPTGLLAGRRATTTWWLAPLLARWEPACTVDADLMVCADGDLVTAGAAFAQTDLMLHLLRTRYGARLTDAVARSLLIDGRQAQAPYVVPEVLANGDELVTRIVARIESALPDPPSVAALAAELAMSERTLARHVTRSTGRSTHALVRSVRMRRARSLLAGTRMTVEQVAVAVGYSDATALRRAMKQSVGAGPSSYRAP